MTAGICRPSYSRSADLDGDLRFLRAPRLAEGWRRAGSMVTVRHLVSKARREVGRQFVRR